MGWRSSGHWWSERMPFGRALIYIGSFQNDGITQSRSNQLCRKWQSGLGDTGHDGYGGVASDIEWRPRLKLMRCGEHFGILDPARRSKCTRGQQNIDDPESLVDRCFHLAPAFLRPEIVVG